MVLVPKPNCDCTTTVHYICFCYTQQSGVLVNVTSDVFICLVLRMCWFEQASPVVRRVAPTHSDMLRGGRWLLLIQITMFKTVQHLWRTRGLMLPSVTSEVFSVADLEKLCSELQFWAPAPRLIGGITSQVPPRQPASRDLFIICH